jgi:hypothetical protein
MRTICTTPFKSASRVITTDFADRRPAEDILCTDESYRDVYARAGLRVVGTDKPLAKSDERNKWVNERKIAPRAEANDEWQEELIGANDE